jgi:UDP-N-acetyl-D-mannosaminuronic acid dehydrogenase
MNLSDLREKIAKKEAKLAVIGLGYVGLPVACTFAKAGLNVTGVDLLQERIAKINLGHSPIEGNEPGLAELLAEVIKSKKFTASGNYENIADCDVVLIAVETPVDQENMPRYEALRSALTSLAKVLKSGALVIIESTIAPGTMDKVVVPILEDTTGRKVNDGFYLGNCPERVMPGRLLKNLTSVGRVVGGMTAETSETMTSLYRQIIPDADLDPADCVTAELVKTTENAYRDVQIAFANEVAMISEVVGGNVWKVRELVNKSPGRHMLQPGAGVGGHCIPKDPWLLAYSANGSGTNLRLIPTARAINDNMPIYVANLLENALEESGKKIKGSRILVMGYAYLEDSDDIRNSPSEVLASNLKSRGADVAIHDPYVQEYQGDVLNKAAGCDAAVLMVKHGEYRGLDLSKLARVLNSSLIVDGRGFYPRVKAEAAGLRYVGIGVGQKA